MEAEGKLGLGYTWLGLGKPEQALAAYRVLQLAHNARASEILEIAYQELRARAEIIPDPETRQMYLENVPWHGEIVSTYRATSPSN